MVITKPFFLFVFFLFVLKQNSIGQTPFLDKNDSELTSLYSKAFSFYHSNYDSLSYYSELFSTQFATFIKSHPTTLNYKFKSLVDGNACHIVTSKDGFLRIYSWDTWLGGTMHDFNNIFQFKSGDKIFSTDLGRNEDDYGCYFTDIFTLNSNGKTYYLAVGGGSYSTKDAYETISTYTISNDTLNDKVKLLKTKTGLDNSISYDFDFFSVADTPERPIKLIKYDTDKKIIYIPIVLENGKVTDRYTLYQFNGIYFEKVQAQKKK